MADSRGFKSSAKAKGHLAEDYAASYLSELGFTVLERNLKEVFGEVDVVAKKGNTFRFVEVKSGFGKRAGGSLPLEIKIDAHKIKRISNVANFYLERKGLEEAPWSIDAVLVRLSGRGELLEIEFIENITL